MRYVVVGAGAIGAYVGAALARGGEDVVLVARGPHLEAIRSRGVRVLSPRGDFEVSVPATDDFDAILEADVVFLGLKANSLPLHAHEIGARLRGDAAVIAAQNGMPWWYFQSHHGPLEGLMLESVDPGGAIASAIDPGRVVGCVLYCSTEIAEPGVIRHVEGTRIAIGEPDGRRSDRCLAIAAAFVVGGLRCPIEEHLREHVWLKMIGNVAFNPVSALTGLTMQDLGLVPELRGLLRAAMEEAAIVASALGVTLPVPLDRRLERAFAVGDHKPSMLQDLEAGKPFELGCLTGAVIELADRLELAVPTTRAVHALATAIDPGGRANSSEAAPAGPAATTVTTE